MKLTWSPMVLLLAVGVGPALGQYHAMGDCPSLASIQPFNPGKFLGTWHINEQYRVRVEEGMTCKTLTFGDDGSVTLNFSAKLKPFSVAGKFLVDASAAGIMKAKFDYSDVLGSDDVGEVLWYVLDTDYTSHAIIAACQQLALTNKQYLYVLTRDLEPSAYDEAKIDVAFRNTHFEGGGELEPAVTKYCGTPKFQVEPEIIPPQPTVSEVPISAHIPQELLNELDSPEILDEITAPPPRDEPQSPMATLITAATTGEDGSYKPAVIHINIADSSISLNSDHPALASVIPIRNSTVTLRPEVDILSLMAAPGSVPSPTTSIPPLRVQTTTDAALESQERFPETTESSATNMYEEIILNDVENENDYQVPKVDGVDARVAAFIARLRNQPNFIEWSEIVDSPSFRRGSTGSNSPVDLFISTLKNRPNFLDFAVNQEENLYRNRIRGNLRPTRT